MHVYWDLLACCLNIWVNIWTISMIWLNCKSRKCKKKKKDCEHREYIHIPYTKNGGQYDKWRYIFILPDSDERRSWSQRQKLCPVTTQENILQINTNTVAWKLCPNVWSTDMFKVRLRNSLDKVCHVEQLEIRHWTLTEPLSAWNYDTI